MVCTPDSLPNFDRSKVLFTIKGDVLHVRAWLLESFKKPFYVAEYRIAADDSQFPEQAYALAIRIYEDLR